MATLRRATSADAAALTHLRGLMHQAMGHELTDEWRLRCEEVFARRLATDVFVAFLLERGENVISGGAGWIEEHLPSPYQLDGRRGVITSMSTDPAHQRLGYGRQVLEELMAWFVSNGIGRVDLRATAEGRPLYEAFGFRVLGGATMSWTASGTRPGMP